MSQPIPDQPAQPSQATDLNEPNEPAQTAALDAGDSVQQSDTASPAAAPSPAAVPQPEPQQPEPQLQPGQPVGDSAPKLADLQNEACPNCHTGVLYVTRYDPDALHEQNQGAALLAGHESGGAYDVVCAYCDFTESRAFNPGPQFGRGA